MADKSSIPIVWTRNRGRDGWSAVVDVETDRSVESRNVHLYNGGLGTRRGGSTSITVTGVTGPINALVEYVPAQDLTASELFLVDSSATTKIFRCAAGSSFSAMTVNDAVSTRAMDVSFTVLNGILFMAYDSAVNRLHCYDPNYSATVLRRVGMAGRNVAAPSVANTGSGGYAATIRYYATRPQEYRVGKLTREGEASAITTFTPSGSGTAARITAPTSLSEGDTHWVAMGSTDGVLFYDLAVTVLGANYDDSATPSTYANGTASPVAGARMPWPSVKYLATDGTHLLGLGSWETAAGDAMSPYNGRVWISPAIDSVSSDFFDSERISNTTTVKGYLDLARNSGSADRGITPHPVNNIFYAFQSTGVYGLVPTESGTTPYRRIVIDTQVGCLSAQSIVCANDRNGRACCYFLDPVRGPYVVGGSDGLRWVGKDVQDLWPLVNKEATNVPAWGVWYPDLMQVWFAVAYGASQNDPNLILVLDVTELTPDEDGDLRGGWTTYDGDLAAARCGVMFSNTLAATRSRSRVPYVGLASGTKLLRYDESVHRDDTTAFQGYVTSGARVVDTTSFALERSYLVAGASSGVSIQQSMVRNGTDETSRTSTVDLTPTGSQVEVLKKFEDAGLQDGWMCQVQLGDAATANVAWELHQWRADLRPGAKL